MSARAAFCRRAWQQMVPLYGAPGVGPACLALQDEFDADVPLLLFLVLADRAGEGLLPADALRLKTWAAEWRALAVVPLRRLRVALRERAATPDLQAFRGSVKSAELEAERLQVAGMAAFFEPLSGPRGLADGYLADLRVPAARIASVLAVLRAAAAQILSSPAS